MFPFKVLFKGWLGMSPKYRCTLGFLGLVENNTHIVAIVVFRHGVALSVSLCLIITSSQLVKKRFGDKMKELIIKYNQMSDTLTLSFAPGEKGTGIKLNDYLLLRLNKREKRAVA